MDHDTTPSKSRSSGLWVTGSSGLPKRDALPWWVQPLPAWLENFGLNLALWVALINFAGTVFGFWYYVPQLSATPIPMWPFVPDSPVATLFIGLSLLLFWLDRSTEYVNVLAFFGCVTFGIWTPSTLLVFKASFATTPTWLYTFLFCSHVAMLVEAFLIQRYSTFPIRAIAVALFWYGANLLVDYFTPIFGSPHHTTFPVQSLGHQTGSFLAKPLFSGPITHVTSVHRLAAAIAVAATLLALFIAFATHSLKQDSQSAS